MTVQMIAGILSTVGVLVVGCLFIYAARFSHTQGFRQWVSYASALDWFLFITGILEIALGEFMIFLVFSPFFML
jgi:hypothetical protein